MIGDAAQSGQLAQRGVGVGVWGRVEREEGKKRSKELVTLTHCFVGESDGHLGGRACSI